MRTRTLLTLGLTLVIAQSAAGAEESGGLEQRLDLELVGAPAMDVLTSFGAVLEAEPKIDPAIRGLVNIQLSDVSARTVLNALCEMLSCEWELVEGPSLELVVKSLAQAAPQPESQSGDLDTPVSLSLRDAPLEEVLESFASIGRWKLQLEKTTVSVELESVPVREALDQVCLQAGCTWSLDLVGDEGVLRVDLFD